MDAFESVVALALRLDGYWTRTSLKVVLTPDEKREIGRPSCPRWEIDVVGYRGGSNELLAVECKSFLDSPGVTFDGKSLVPAKNYKLFCDATLRRVVLGRMVAQLVATGACAPNPRVTLCLAAGKLRKPKEEALLRDHFAVNGWRLMAPAELAERLEQCGRASYENDVAYVVAKMIGRKARRP